MEDLVRKREAVVHIVLTTANYLRFLAILVSGAYALVVLMPRQIRYLFSNFFIRTCMPEPTPHLRDPSFA
jgi:hypothetical protein